MNSSSLSSEYDAVRSAVSETGTDSRVEVNQRALIDKILARYATANAVYRELIQNSNDAEAQNAEIRFKTTTKTTTTVAAAGKSVGNNSVTEVVYRNDGNIFGTEDWARLAKIAEGNPNPDKVGAFGVGAYTMFSLCEEPLIISGGKAMAFLWRGDALWTKTGPASSSSSEEDGGRSGGKKNVINNNKWTTFVLKSRDMYPLPNMVEFGKFLSTSLTFTNCLRSIKVYVNETERLIIDKSIIGKPSIIKPIPSSSWFKNDGAVTSSPKGLFSLGRDHKSITETKVKLTVTLDGTISTVQARYVSAIVTVKVPTDVTKRMVRVTKKKPPTKVRIQIFIGAPSHAAGGAAASSDTAAVNPSLGGTKPSNNNNQKSNADADAITSSFSPSNNDGGGGRIFIGFRTSQTTGFPIHFAAPLLPTVEREAIDFQDVALKLYNEELLFVGGIVMRLALEHYMSQIGHVWKAKEEQFVNEEEKWRDMLLVPEEEKRREKTTGIMAGGDGVPSSVSANAKSSKQAKKDGSSDGDNSGKTKDENSATAATNNNKSLFGLAKYMATGVKKRIVDAVKSTIDAVGGSDDAAETNNLLHPPDPRPLSNEEHDAVSLMQSFCPTRSTPDPIVGTVLARGFVDCMAKISPPILTKTGVVAGSVGRLPNKGMEVFVRQNVVRDVVYRNAMEYHDLVACCRPLELSDLVNELQRKDGGGERKRVWKEGEVVRLIKWWTKYSCIDVNGTREYGSAVKENVTFVPTKVVIAEGQDDDRSSRGMQSATITKGKTNVDEGNKKSIRQLKDILYYTDKTTYPHDNLPMPTSVIPSPMQGQIKLRTLEDPSLQRWFTTLPMDVWTIFISEHPCLTNGSPHDNPVRLRVLSTLSAEYSRRRGPDKVAFGELVKSLLSERRCLPFDTSHGGGSPAPEDAASSSSPEGSTAAAAAAATTDVPTELYLNSAELRPFASLGSFRKVSTSVSDAGVTNEFLLTIGVRETIAIDLLFIHLDTLCWSDDPGPLISYLRGSTLTECDMEKLRTTRYLPAEGDTSRLYAPSELFLPNNELKIFPFVKLLQWPSSSSSSTREELVSVRSADGSFLRKLGCRLEPDLKAVLTFLANDVTDDDKLLRSKSLDFVCKRLGPGGPYVKSMALLNKINFLPCLCVEPLDVGCVPRREMCTPNTCYSNPTNGLTKMGFPILDPELERKSGGMYSTRFRCRSEPDGKVLIDRLLDITGKAQLWLKTCADDAKVRKQRTEHISLLYGDMFKYLSTRTDELETRTIETLKNNAFIPCKTADTSDVEWYQPKDVYFHNPNDVNAALTELLFHVIDFSPFLAAVGVKSEASTQDVFRLLLSSPHEVWSKVGRDEVKYRALLRQIAANPPFKSVTNEMRKSPFLIAYQPPPPSEDKSDGVDQKKNDANDDNNTSIQRGTTCKLAKAEDIYIIDNSLLGRMFPVLRAPAESNLEDLYSKLGSNYISQSVDKAFEVVGAKVQGKNKQFRETSLTVDFIKRIRERRPLLVSPNVTSRPLVKDAESILDDANLSVCEVDHVRVVYSLGTSSKGHDITCCAKPHPGGRGGGGRKHGLYITQKLDWFDVGNAIGGLILRRCRLEDAFFLGSLLEAPLEQLRARGFPVDRIQRPTTEVTMPESGPSSVPPADGLSIQSQGGGQQHGDKTPDGEGYVNIVKQMFPNCSENYIRQRLGSHPSLDRVREVADSLASSEHAKGGTDDGKESKSPNPDNVQKPPNAAAAPSPSLQGDGAVLDNKKPNPPKKRGAKKLLNRVISGRRGQGSVATQPPRVKAVAGSGPSSPYPVDDGNPVPPQRDAASHKGLEAMLKTAAGNSRKVSSSGVSAPETLLTSVPEGLERGSDGCEIIPGHQLKPFSGPYRTGMSSNGIRVFASRKGAGSEDFLRDNFVAVDAFAAVLRDLCLVYSLDVGAVAIFHEPSGGTIAFNANRALHFNVRFFCALHFVPNQRLGGSCYSYWFTVMAHELAHNLVSAHNKEHGYYTESYVSMFLPKLAALLSQQGCV